MDPRPLDRALFTCEDGERLKALERAGVGRRPALWDAEWDMFLALVGAIVALLLGSRAHDRFIARVPYPTA